MTSVPANFVVLVSQSIPGYGGGYQMTGALAFDALRGNIYFTAVNPGNTATMNLVRAALNGPALAAPPEVMQ